MFAATRIQLHPFTAREFWLGAAGMNAWPWPFHARHFSNDRNRPFESLVTKSLDWLDLGTSARGGLLSRLAAAVLAAVRELAPEGQVAIYFEPHFDELAFARIDPMVVSAAEDGYRLELRLASWLTTVDDTQLRTVPKYLIDWIPIAKVLVVPLIDGTRRRGFVVVDATKIARESVQQLEQLARDVSGKLSKLERRTPPALDPALDRFAHSVRRIKRDD